MRRLFFKYTFGPFIINIFIVLLLVFPSHTFALEDDRNDDKFYKVVPKLICEILELQNCNISQPDQNQNNPTPYPTGGQPFPTSNPQITPPSGKCMPPGGIITCGTEFVPIRNCAHCSVKQYPPGFRKRFCTPGSGNAEAIDIAHKPLDSVPLPYINGHTILWTHTIDKFYSDGSDPYAAYQEYVGLDLIDKIQYRVRYIHTLKGSGPPLGKQAESGTEGAKVCQKWVTYSSGTAKVATCNHVHIQIFNGLLGKWVPATDYYCRQ